MNRFVKNFFYAFSLLFTGHLVSHTHRIFNKGHLKFVGPSSVRAFNNASFLVNDVRVYFSPDDNIRHHLIQAIEREQTSIAIAIFTLTDSQIAHAFLHAHRRGVKVEIVTDPTGLKDRFNKITMLSQEGVPVYVYSTHNGSGLHSCMHHKFAIFEKNHENQRYVWTGSFNFTKSASESNQENVVIIHQDKVVERFQGQFKKIKNRSQRLVSETSLLLRNKR